jgi:hypothetical protein
MDTPRGGRARGLRPRMRLPGPDAASPALNWVGGERIAIGSVPSARLVARPAEQGVTHIVNCRSAAGAMVRGSSSRAGGLRPRPGRARAHAGSRAAAAARSMGGGGLLRRPGAHRAAAGGSAHPLQRGPTALAHARLRGAPAARTCPWAGGSTRAELPDRGRTGSGLCPQRQAVARHGSPVTSAMPDRKGIRRAVPPWRVRLRMERRRERVPNLPICSRSTFSRKATSPYHA